MGNALVDALSRCPDDGILEHLGLEKGCMTLVDGETYQGVRAALEDLSPSLCVGGCAGNCVRAFSALGGEAGFIGTVGDDAYGTFFRKSLSDLHIRCHLSVLPGKHTGVASTFISSDGERTFGTFLGASGLLSEAAVDESVFKDYGCFFIEGYLVQDHELILSSMRKARQAGTRICLDLASSNVVSMNRDFFWALIDEYVDIVMANEQEASALTGLTAEAAASQIGRHCAIAVVKTGSKGSIIVSGGQRLTVEVVPVEKVVDTTGAGDCYAAGFLYGLLSGLNLAACARIASLTAASVIQVVGTSLTPDALRQLRQETASIIEEST